MTKQAIAPAPVPFAEEAFQKQEGTSIRWLANSGALINSRGTTLMIDPVLEGFDMPLLVNPPVKTEDVPALDAILLTHCDNDHYSRITCAKLSDRCGEYDTTKYVASLLKDELGIEGNGYGINDSFTVKDVKVTLTPADHAWQNESPKHHTREFKMEDACGFWIDTPDGSIWAVGDSRLMPEQLTYPQPDAMLFDFSDSRWHIGLEGAEKMAAAYPDAPLIVWHWGCVDAPEWKEFNGDPEVLKSRIVNPGRVVVLAPGEEYTLKKR